MTGLFPLLLEPETLYPLLHEASLLVVDLSGPQGQRIGHIPGATHLEYGALLATQWPIGGLLPNEQHLGRVLSATGLTPESHVVAYDDEGGGKAGRLLWTLDVLGHRRFSLLNGGLYAWANEGYPLERGANRRSPSRYQAAVTEHAHADKDYILGKLGNPDVTLLDVRTPEEFHGLVRYAARAGHIPGAVNMDWTLTIDTSRNLRLKPENKLRELLERRGVTPDREVIVYCQTHHRSSHTYAVLKVLGYPRIRGYPGSWSEWGNLATTPVE
ncbi:MAG: sulfurtransferase [Gammaproteobacteria bacterium]